MDNQIFPDDTELGIPSGARFYTQGLRQLDKQTRQDELDRLRSGGTSAFAVEATHAWHVHYDTEEATRFHKKIEDKQRGDSVRIGLRHYTVSDIHQYTEVSPRDGKEINVYDYHLLQQPLLYPLRVRRTRII